MAKAVLVMDMPDSCDVCDYVDDTQPPRYGERTLYCMAPGIGEDVTDYVACRPDFCPLRELPERETEMTDADDLGKDYVRGTMDGWNACLDEITR